MNEKIKELYDDASHSSYVRTDGNGNDHYRRSTDYELFAELIIRECIVLAKRERIRNGSDTEHNQAVSKVIESIKEHFGIAKE